MEPPILWVLRFVRYREPTSWHDADPNRYREGTSWQNGTRGEPQGERATPDRARRARTARRTAHSSRRWAGRRPCLRVRRCLYLAENYPSIYTYGNVSYRPRTIADSTVMSAHCDNPLLMSACCDTVWAYVCLSRHFRPQKGQKLSRYADISCEGVAFSRHNPDRRAESADTAAIFLESADTAAKQPKTGFMHPNERHKCTSAPAWERSAGWNKRRRQPFHAPAAQAHGTVVVDVCSTPDTCSVQQLCSTLGCITGFLRPFRHSRRRHVSSQIDRPWGLWGRRCHRQSCPPSACYRTSTLPSAPTLTRPSARSWMVSG